jgi:hypothetical protein
MKRTALVLATLLSVAGVAAHAETPDLSGQFAHRSVSVKSRSEVRAELQEAQRTGDVLAAGDTGLTLSQLNPSAYPAKTLVAGKTREQVREETAEAIRNGDIVAGEYGLTEREVFPQQYAGSNASHAPQWIAGHFHVTQ